MLQVAGFAGDSIVDGPGLRFTVFFQGCPHHCPGCHNPGTHDPAGGREVSVAELAAELSGNPLTDGLTLSGGEPFCQAAECAALARIASLPDTDPLLPLAAQAYDEVERIIAKIPEAQ